MREKIHTFSWQENRQKSLIFNFESSASGQRMQIIVSSRAIGLYRQWFDGQEFSQAITLLGHFVTTMVCLFECFIQLFVFCLFIIVYMVICL